ncbi:MAG: hypothetical protein M0004_06925 [Actinomycetota bacterium]|nr:hypothetical protein [Actinomycetota bacterium]
MRAHSLAGHVGGWVTFTVNGVDVPGCTHIALRRTDTAICHLSGYARPGTYVVSAYYSGSGKYVARVMRADEHVAPPWHKVWILSSTGSVQARGGTSAAPSTTEVTGARASSPVAVAATPNDAGYWVLEGSGRVEAVGNARREGPRGRPSKGPFVAIASSVDGRGYFLLSRRGAIDSFGDAPVLHGAKLRSAAVGFAITPDGRGALILCRDGAIVAFGDAKVLGEPAARHARGPFVGIVEDPSGRGYLVLTARGVVLSFGNAHRLGNGPAGAAPYRAIASTGDGHGYFLLARDDLFGFGDARGLLGRSGAFHVAGSDVAIAGT